MNEHHIDTIARDLNLDSRQVKAAAELLAEGATVPFIARYRKERTGSLDEQAVLWIRDELTRLAELDKRRDTVLRSLDEQGKLSKELQARVRAAATLSELEDLYLPYRPKRRTRGTMAKEKGLEPLAQQLFDQGEGDPEAAAAEYVDPEKGVSSVEEALAGARDIVAEWVNEDAEARNRLRALFERDGRFICKVAPGKEAEGSKYRDYFDWEEPVASAPSHRVLAMRRGEKEGVLSLRAAPPEDKALALLEARFLRGMENAFSLQVREAVHDAYKRLLSHAMETEIRLQTKRGADDTAIRVFAENLRQLLMAPPLGRRRILALDPGFRTGCKLVCLDAQGKLLHTDTIYPHQSERARLAAGETVEKLCTRFEIEAVAIGNGTAGRETETFVRNLNLPKETLIVMVDESGASVYSASEAGREEFPDQDITVRGAVSIGRRLMDPLSELVKIDPKSIGVGQYQHDVDQKALKQALDDVVVSSVNAVGVEVNTASRRLLTYVSGLGPRLAQNIVEWRDENGPFSNRSALKKVPRLGEKAFEQAAGFLRIQDGDNPLDASSVHPESYPIVGAMARNLGCTVTDLLTEEALRQRLRLEDYVSETVGMPTLQDILAELAKPGRDPRTRFEQVSFAGGVETLEDLKPGMSLPGVVTNITAFGAFVDVGVHQDGLVHISEMADRFVKDPNEVVKLRQQVMVRVLDVDPDRRRISLSLRQQPGPKPARKPPEKRSAPDARPKKGRGKPREAFNRPFARLGQ